MAKKSEDPNLSAGFIRLPRSLLESEKWNSLRLKQQKLFLYILLKAQHSPYVYKHNGKDIQLMPGDLCVSMRRLVDDFNDSVKFKDEKIDLSFLQRAIRTFLKVGLTDTRTDTEITVIRVIYPGIYDSKKSMTDTQSDTLSIQKRYSHLKEECKKEKKSHPSIPSNEGKLMTDDFSFEREKERVEVIPGIFLSQEEIEECVKIKGSLEKVQRAMKFIQESKKRKHAIGDWPKALASWKIEDEAKSRAKSNVDYTERLCQEFQEFGSTSGWRCYMYTDRKKDQRGVLFESQSAYQEAFFVALADGELREKCEEFIQKKKMRSEN